MCRRTDIIDRILSKVNIEDTGFVVNGQSNPCFLWQGGTSGNGRGGGYGRISIDGVTSAVHKVVATHYYGYIPSSRQVDHLCGIRNCCNPAHLEVVTHKENQKRRDARLTNTEKSI